MMLNSWYSSIVVQGMTVELRPWLHFQACGWGCVGWKPGWGCVGWKPPAGKGVDSLLNWQSDMACTFFITFCKVWHSDGHSVTKPDYYMYCVNIIYI